MFMINYARLRATLFASLISVLLTGLLVVSCSIDDTNLLVNAKTPSITTQPSGGDWDVSDEEEFTLTVTVSVTDGGRLSYQWYENTTNSVTGGDAVSGATSATITLEKDNYLYNEDCYFYVVITNTNNAATGTKTAAATSEVATVTVSGNLVNARHPTITSQPTGGSWDISDEEEFTLTVTADSPDDGELSYQWYKNSADNTDGEEIDDENEATLSLKKEHYTGDGDHYFYVAVTNTITDNNDGGTKTATTTSNVVKVTVSGNGVEAVNAQAPTISVQPTGGFWNIWLTNESFSKNTANLTVTASPSDDGNLSYQWYVNSANSTNGSTLLTGKTSATLSLTPVEIASTYTTIDNGTNYFYVVVTNTIADNDDGGTKIATRTSNIINVTVDGVATGIIGYWEPNNYMGDDYIITPNFHLTSIGFFGYNEYQGQIQYVSFFNYPQTPQLGIIIIKYDPGKENTWFSGEDPTGDYLGIYIERYVPGVSWGITTTSDMNNSSGPPEAATLEAAIERFDENGGGVWFMEGLTPDYLFKEGYVFE